jgi:hypothetical protein
VRFSILIYAMHGYVEPSLTIFSPILLFAHNRNWRDIYSSPVAEEN